MSVNRKGLIVDRWIADTTGAEVTMSSSAPIQHNGAAPLQSHEPSLVTLVQRNQALQLSITPPDASSAPMDGKKRQAKYVQSTQPSSKRAKTSTAKKTKAKKPKTTAGGGGVKGKGKAKSSPSGGGINSSENVDDEDLPPSDEKPLFNIRDIIADLLDRSQQDGLDRYVDSGRQFTIRVGTLCSGTDAPIHIMELFGMLKNDEGNQVFTTINCFGCEIEPFKQGFLMRNSKPQLLFRDARDFARAGAKQA